MIDPRFQRNIGTLTEEEQDIIRGKKVLVIGCGGLGSFSIEYLARLGINTLRFVDADVYDRTNLNRQLYNTERTIGMSKAVVAADRVMDINSDVVVDAVHARVDENNVDGLIKGMDLVIDALDNVPTRLLLQSACEKQGVPMVFGAVSEWYGQVATIYPGDKALEKIFKEHELKRVPSVLAMSAAAVSSFQISEAVKVLLGKPMLRGKLLYVDLYDYETQIFQI